MQNKLATYYCKSCNYPIDPDDMVIDGVCEFCIDNAQDARDWEETYNELNRWVG